MIKIQKIIKYCSIAFALFLVFNIIITIMLGVISIGNIFSSNNNDISIIKKLETTEINKDIKLLNIELKSTNIIIKEGTNLKIETNNKYINLKENNSKLSIIEKKTYINQ